MIQRGGNDITSILMLVRQETPVLHRLLLLRGDLEGVLEYLSQSRALGNRAGTIFQILYVFLNPLGKEK